MSEPCLLPQASLLEQRLSDVLKRVFATEIPIACLWQIDHCPKALLPYLAWSLSVDSFDSQWSEETQRNTLRSAFYLHSHKGSVASIRRVLSSSGYGEVEIVENLTQYQHDSTIVRDGSKFRGASDLFWAMYRVYLQQPISIEQAEQVKTLLLNTAPARCHLAGLHFEQAQFLHNGKLYRNGIYTRGVA